MRTWVSKSELCGRRQTADGRRGAGGTGRWLCVYAVWALSLLLLPIGTRSEPNSSGLTLLTAVRETLRRQPAILVQRANVENSEGVLQTMRGPFDWTLTSSLSYADQRTALQKAQASALGRDTAELGIASYTAGLQKQLRSGVTVGPNIQFTRTEDLSFDQGEAEEAILRFTVTAPLLRGRGRAATGAGEMAAQAGLEGSRLALRYAMSVYVYQTVLAYWQWLLLYEQLAIHREAESEAKTLVQQMRKLIEADQRPAADLDQVVANLADKRARRIAAEQQLFEARQGMGLAVGLLSEEINDLGAPGGAFPEVDPTAIPDPSGDPRFLDLACRRRADLLAAREQGVSAQILWNAARINVRPQVDLVLDVSYSERYGRESFSQYATQGEWDLSAVAALHCGYPIRNNAARGALVQRHAAYRQAVLSREDLERTIRSHVAVALAALRRSVQELSSAREAVAFYRKAAANERKKLGMGMSTVIDVVTMDDRLRGARLGEVVGRQNYAVALVRLRHETGTLFSGEGEEGSIGRAALTTLPSF